MEQHSNTIKIVLGKRFLGMEQHSNTIKMETLSIPTQPVRQRVLRIWNNLLISLLKIKHFHSNSTLGKRFLGMEQHHSNTIKIETFSFQLNPLGKGFFHSNSILGSESS